MSNHKIQRFPSNTFLLFLKVRKSITLLTLIVSYREGGKDKCTASLIWFVYHIKEGKAAVHLTPQYVYRNFSIKTVSDRTDF